MAYKVKHFAPVYLYSGTIIGYSVALQDLDTGNLITIWGTSKTSYALLDWACSASEVECRTYQDGFNFLTHLRNIPRTLTVEEISNLLLAYPDINVSVDCALVGVNPNSLRPEAIEQDIGPGGVVAINSEIYQPYARSRAWSLYNTSSLSIIATKPKFCLNFLSYSMLINFVEQTLQPGAIATRVKASTGIAASRVRWGDTGSALCGTIAMEDPDANNAGFVDLIETPGPITGVFGLEDRLVVLKSRSIYELVYTGYPNYFTPSVVVVDNGTDATDSVVRFGNGFGFVGQDDIYLYQAGGQLQPIGTNIKSLLFGPEAIYSKDEIAKMRMYSFVARKELWLWMPDENIIYKFQEGAWFKTDYSSYGNLQAIGISAPSDVEEDNPVLLFDQSDVVTIEVSTDYLNYQKATLRTFYDNQTGYDSSTESFFETQDVAFGVQTRFLELKFQAKCDNLEGNVEVQFSLNEGATWSDIQTITIAQEQDLDWYRVWINDTSESIRFKFKTSSPISIGKLQLGVVDRKKEDKAVKEGVYA